VNTTSQPNYDFGSPEELLSSGLELDDIILLHELEIITGTQFQKYSSVLDPNYQW
jgi:hypothetical protein